jgi:hypothetical protein
MKTLADNAEKKDTGSKDFGEWLKLESGETTLRICPPWSAEGSPFRKLRNHNGPFKTPYMTPEGKRVAPLCFDFLFSASQAHLAEIAAPKLGKDDRKLFEEYGCPMDCLAQYLVKHEDKKAASGWWPRTQFIWNVINRANGGLYKWSCSQKIATPIEAMFKMYQQVFDPEEGRDFTIKATGEGSDRRYEAPVFHPYNSPLDFDGELNDLDDVALIGVRPFDEVLGLVISNHTNIPLENKLSAGLIDYAEAKGMIS